MPHSSGECNERDLAHKQTEEIEVSIASQRRILEDLTARGKDTTDARRFLEVLIRCRDLRLRKATSRVPRQARTMAE
jgi:hypothetical protein